MALGTAVPIIGPTGGTGRVEGAGTNIRGPFSPEASEGWVSARPDKEGVCAEGAGEGLPAPETAEASFRGT
ncbi:MAG TPA: hypothetical protein PK777_06620 [Thermoguttaceae bacterium]|nr:hypothetical protein [Thermoguttaceae bacterium]HPP52603.1 hypothetical protein [Thermoguttaceae bacterium]